MLLHFRTLYTAHTNGGTSAKTFNMMASSTLNCNDMKWRFDIMHLNLKENEYKNHKNQFQNGSLAYIGVNDQKDKIKLKK